MIRKILLTTAVVIGLGLLALLYYRFDPLESELAPKCLFHAVTGLDCPGCGFQRMLHALLHGDISSAWRANPFTLLLLPLLGLMTYSAMTRLRHPRLYAVLNSLPMIIAISSGITLWFILRNWLL